MFRFTIRELVLVTLVVGLGVGWWVDHRRLKATALRASEQWQAAEDRNNLTDAHLLWIERQLENYGLRITWQPSGAFSNGAGGFVVSRMDGELGELDIPIDKDTVRSNSPANHDALPPPHSADHATESVPNAPCG